MKTLSELKKCKFCQDVKDDLNDFAELRADLGDLGEISVRAAISCFDKNYHPVMGFYMTFQNTDLTETDLQWKRIDINYCPICGRDMAREGERGNVQVQPALPEKGIRLGERI